MSESPRTCANCACLKVIEPPVLASKQIPNPAAIKTQYVCRLNPPFMVQLGQGQGLMQSPTTPESVCWWWKPQGTLPGDPPGVLVMNQGTVWVSEPIKK
jgi:hypothetical protein